MKHILLVALLIGTGAIAWHVNNGDRHLPDELRSWFGGNSPGGVSNDASLNTPHAGKGSVRKCVNGAEVIYTDAPCPTDRQEKAMEGGSVTVVKGQRPKVELPAMSASMPNARALRGDPNEPSLMEQRIERAVNQ